MSNILSNWSSLRGALVIAHPGHELRVFGWLERAKPLAFVFTDGSGGASEGRIGSTENVFAAAGVSHGGLFGRFTDRQLYQLVMEGRHGVFIALADELARAFVAADVDYVAGDAVEGYNPSHDICRMVIGAALARHRRLTGRSLPSFDFLLTGRPDECPAQLRAGSIRLVLDDAALARKLAAARGYGELAHELQMAVERAGLDSFRHEWLRPSSRSAGYDGFGSRQPYYETYGEKMVGQGRYREVLRWDQHMKPLADALRNAT